MGRVNLYETLGVSRQDCSVAVRHAYRDLARRSHATTEAVPLFVREMELAVAVLSDGARRTHYDEAPVAELEPDIESDEERLDLLRDFQGGPPSREEVRHAFRGNFDAASERKSGRVDVLELRIGLPARSGGHVLLLGLPVFHPCAGCHGTGSIASVACAACDGSGLAKVQALVRIFVTAGERAVSLVSLGIRTPILRVSAAPS